MIEEEKLQLISKLMNAGDQEMVRLGEEIFIQHNPTSEDVDLLNNMHGFHPIMYTYMQLQIDQVLGKVHVERDLFPPLKEEEKDEQ